MAAKLEDYLVQDTLYADQAQADFRDMQGAALRLLERDDAGPLLLTLEEVMPWAEVFAERMAPLEARAREMAEQETPDYEEIQHAAREALVQLAREMAAAVFTPARLDTLVERLAAYREQLHQAGERRAAMSAQVALMTVRRTEDPADEPFVLMVCATSLQTLISEYQAWAAERA
jgi:hypothetical protein